MFKSLKKIGLFSLIFLFFGMPLGYADEGDDLSEIKAEIERIKEAYESEIARLEQRIEELETKEIPAATPDPQPAPQETAPRPVAGSSGGVTGSAFNPAIGVIFNGRFSAFKQDPELYRVPGFPLFGEAGPGAEGFALDETELNFSSNVNDLFYASATIAFDASDEGTEVELEEAYIQTLTLPSGLTLKAGRFFAALGYLNENHSHTDNFVNRPLVYQAFMGGDNYNDDGVQVAIVLPTITYIQFGGGYFRGGDYPAGGAADGGRGAYTAFARVGGDIGFSSSYRFGFSYLNADAVGQMFGPEDGAFPDLLTFSGKTELFIADFKFQWSPNGNVKEKYFLLQGEFFKRSQNGFYDGIAYAGRDSGFYVEGVYKFSRGWRAGYRYDQLNPDNTIPTLLLGTGLDAMGHTPRMHSFNVDWSRNEFSLVRLQFSNDQSQLFNDNRIFLQFIMSIGAHGAHNF